MELSGVAFKYLLAALNIDTFPPIQLYWIDSFKTMKYCMIEYFEKDSTVLRSKQVIPGVMLLIKGSVKIQSKNIQARCSTPLDVNVCHSKGRHGCCNC